MTETRPWTDVPHIAETVDNGQGPGPPVLDETEAAGGVTAEAQPARSSWAPIDLTDALAGRDVDPATLLQRTDGLGLLYAGRVHWFSGESETCKSWAAQLVAAVELEADRDVLYVDYEDDEHGVVSHLKALGVPAGKIAGHLVYIRPDEALADRYGNPTAAAADLEQVLDERTYALCIIDGITEAMTTESLEITDNADVARFMRTLPRRIANRGACVVCIDHVAKAAEAGSRYALGGGHKLAGVTGAAYKFVARRPFYRATGAEPVEGEVAMAVTKDRPGHVRGRTRDGDVGTLRLTAFPDGTVSIDLAPPGEATPDPHLVRRILDYLATYEGSSQNAVELGVEGKGPRVREALKWMVDKGLVDVEHKGRSHLHSLTDKGRSWTR